MNRNRYVRVALLFLVSSSSVVATGAQPLSNPGLEPPYYFLAPTATCPAIGGDLAGGWFDNSCWPGNETAVVTYDEESSGVHGGLAAQRITTQAGIMQFTQQLTVERDKLYELSVWMRATAPMPVTLMLRKLGPPYSAYATATFEVGPAWQEYTVQGIAEDDEAFFMIRTEAAGELWVDDAGLTVTALVFPLPTEAIPRSFVGNHFHGSTIPWPPAGELSAVRIWDAAGPGSSCAQWVCVNPAPGVYDWSALDQHVDRALAEGADVLFVLGRGPRWAAARPDDPSPYGPGQSSEPADMQVWRDWVTAVGTRYVDKIRYWETWNEPNDAQFFSGTPETLLALTQEAHAILKSIDPGNRMVSPSPYDLGWLDQYLGLGGGAYADVIGYHFYIIGSEPEILYNSYIPNARLILQNHGLDQLPLWNTEAGWFSTTPVVGDEEGVGYVARSYLLNWARGVDRFYYYAWDQFPAGIELAGPPDFDVPTVAGVAYDEVTRWMVGSRMTDLTVDGQGTWIVELLHGSGVTGHVVWNPQFDAAVPLSFTLPSPWNAQWKRELSGQVVSVGALTTVPVDARPILLTPTLDVDGDGIDDLDDNCPSASNVLQEDLDGDRVGDLCDNCGDWPNPEQRDVPFGATMLATGPTQFCWDEPATVVWAVGNLTQVGSYGIDSWTTIVGAADCFSHGSVPAIGSGSYYLVRPQCGAGSWQTELEAEPGRDLVLP